MLLSFSSLQELRQSAEPDIVIMLVGNKVRFPELSNCDLKAPRHGVQALSKR